MWAAVAALCLAQFMDVLGVTVVVTSLPSMLADLHASQSFAGLITTGYAMFFGGLLMVGARLGDRYGHRRTILASLSVFAVGAVVAATAGSAVTLTVARCLQGAAAAAAVPSALRLLTTLTTDPTARRRAIAAWSATGAAAGAAGFVVGGAITDLTSWRFVFWSALPLAVVVGVVIAVTVPPEPAVDPTASLNLAVAGTFTAAVMAFVLAATVIIRPGGRLAGAALLGCCAVLTLLFARIDRRATAPLLPSALLAIRRLRQGALGGFLNTATTSSAMTLVTLYLQNTLRRSPLDAAIALLPFSLAVIAGSGLSATLQRRLRSSSVIAVGLATIALADFALIPLAGHLWAVPLCAAVAGAGIGLSSVAATDLGTDVDPGWRAAASGIINTAAQLGTAVGVAALLLIAAATTGVPAKDTGPPLVAWAAGAVLAAAGAVRFAVMPDERGPRPSARPEAVRKAVGRERRS